MKPSAPVMPVSGADRIGEVDIIRGLALFGVLWMNFVDNAALNVPAELIQALPTAPVDKWVGFFTSWLVSRKAQALFSLLFGFGFAILTDRAARRGANAERIYLRRVTILLAVGIAHLLLIWMGDILHAYAAMGLLLLLTRKWPSRLLLVIGIPLAIGGMAALSLYNYLTLPAGTQPAWVVEMMAGPERRWAVLQGSDYGAYVAELLRFAGEVYTRPTGYIFLGWILGRFMIGAWIFRRGWLQDTARHAAGFRRWAAILLAVGLSLALVRPLLRLLELRPPPELQPLVQLNEMTSQLVLALGYGAGVVVLCQSERWRRLLSGFGAAGQMALTNYLAQSLAYLFVLYGFGLGWLGYSGFTFCFVVASIIFAGQIAFSRWWLARYRFGPAEWLWRSATYGTRQPLRRAPAESLAAA